MAVAEALIPSSNLTRSMSRCIILKWRKFEAHRVLTFPHCFRANTEVSQKCGLEATTLLLWQNLERCCHCLFFVRIFTQPSGSSLRAQQLQPTGSGRGEMLCRLFDVFLFAGVDLLHAGGVSGLEQSLLGRHCYWSAPCHWPGMKLLWGV